MTSFVCMICARLSKKKYFIDIRDIFSDSLESSFKNNFVLKHLIFITKLMEKNTYKNAAGVNIISPGFKSYFEKMGLDTSNWSRFTNGIDSEFINYDFKKNKSHNKKKIITYAGNIGYAQGLHKFLPFILKNSSDDFEFHIYGDGKYKNVLMNLIKKDNLSNIKLFDPVKRSNLLEIYRESDALLITLNNKDAFSRVIPSKIFEYAATNKPIFGTLHGFSLEFVKNELDSQFVVSSDNYLGLRNSLNNLNHFLNKPLSIENDNIDFHKRFKRSNIMEKLGKRVFNDLGILYEK